MPPKTPKTPAKKTADVPAQESEEPVEEELKKIDPSTITLPLTKQKFPGKLTWRTKRPISTHSMLPLLSPSTCVTRTESGGRTPTELRNKLGFEDLFGGRVDTSTSRAKSIASSNRTGKKDDLASHISDGTQGWETENVPTLSEADRRLVKCVERILAHLQVDNLDHLKNCMVKSGVPTIKGFCVDKSKTSLLSLPRKLNPKSFDLNQLFFNRPASKKILTKEEEQLRSIFRYYAQYGDVLNWQNLNAVKWNKLGQHIGLFDKLSGLNFQMEDYELIHFHATRKSRGKMDYDQFYEALLEVGMYIRHDMSQTSKFAIEQDDLEEGRREVINDYLLPRARRSAMTTSGQEFFLPDLAKMIGNADHVLSQIFNFYSTLEMSRQLQMVSMNALKESRNLMDFPSLFQFCKDFDIYPHLMTRRHVAEVFQASNYGVAQDRNFEKLHYGEFVDALCRIAVMGFGTEEDKRIFIYGSEVEQTSTFDGSEDEETRHAAFLYWDEYAEPRKISVPYNPVRDASTSHSEIRQKNPVFAGRKKMVKNWEWFHKEIMHYVPPERQKLILRPDLDAKAQEMMALRDQQAEKDVMHRRHWHSMLRKVDRQRCYVRKREREGLETLSAQRINSDRDRLHTSCSIDLSQSMLGVDTLNRVPSPMGYVPMPRARTVSPQGMTDRDLHSRTRSPNIQMFNNTYGTPFELFFTSPGAPEQIPFSLDEVGNPNSWMAKGKRGVLSGVNVMPSTASMTPGQGARPRSPGKLERETPENLIYFYGGRPTLSMTPNVDRKFSVDGILPFRPDTIKGVVEPAGDSQHIYEEPQSPTDRLEKVVYRPSLGVPPRKRNQFLERAKSGPKPKYNVTMTPEDEINSSQQIDEYETQLENYKNVITLKPEMIWKGMAQVKNGDSRSLLDAYAYAVKSSEGDNIR